MSTKTHLGIFVLLLYKKKKKRLFFWHVLLNQRLTILQGQTWQSTRASTSKGSPQIKNFQILFFKMCTNFGYKMSQRPRPSLSRKFSPGPNVGSVGFSIVPLHFYLRRDAKIVIYLLITSASMGIIDDADKEFWCRGTARITLATAQF